MDFDFDFDFPYARWLEYQDAQEHQRRWRRVRRVVIDRMNPFVAMEDEEFTERFRLHKHTMHDLIQEIQDELFVTEDRKGVPIPPHLQVLTTVASMANGSHQIVIGDCYSVSQSSISRCVARVARAIARRRDIHVKFPAPNETRQTCDEFYAIAGMPGVIGCIDCTHVPIIRPSTHDSELYRCRKGYFSINVQAVCDAKLRFTNVVARWYGSAHDSRIFENSLILDMLEGGAYQGHLLGDSGYPCRKYLLTPIHVPNDRQGEDLQVEAYNRSHVRTRNPIERAFGVLKRRFATLGKTMRTKMGTTKAIIVAAVVLHNMAVESRILDDDMDMVDIQDNQVPEYAPGHAQNVAGHAKREHIVRTNF